jgi:molecular chaperone DnaK (HSP70)
MSPGATGIALRSDTIKAARSIGVEIHGGDLVVLIAEGSRTPVAHAMTFTTVADGQKAVEIRVVRRHEGAASSSIVGRFLLLGVRAAPRGEARIDIGLSLDSAGVLHAWAADRSTGARQEAFFPGTWATAAETPLDARTEDAVTALATIVGERRFSRRAAGAAVPVGAWRVTSGR